MIDFSIQVKTSAWNEMLQKICLNVLIQEGYKSL